MSASPSQRPLSAAPSTVGTDPSVRFIVRATADQAALIRRAAAATGMSATRLILLAALSEAERPRADDQELARSTDRRRLDLINEAFDRLGAALGESKKSVKVLDDLIHRARCQTVSASCAPASEGGSRKR